MPDGTYKFVPVDDEERERRRRDREEYRAEQEFFRHMADDITDARDDDGNFWDDPF